MRSYRQRVGLSDAPSRLARRLVAAATGFAALFATLAVAPASGVLINKPCVGARPSGSGPCTAGDLVFSLIGLGTQEDGCVGPGDTLTIQFRGDIAIQTSGERYDIGMFIDQNGVSAQSTGSTCAVKALTGLGAIGDETCDGSPAPESGTGPYINYDGDFCGDSTKTFSDPACDGDGDGISEAAVNFGGPVTLPCKALTPDSNGFVHVASCITWGNNDDQVGDFDPPGQGNPENKQCNNENDLHPGTGSKCNCQDATNSNVPLPNLALSCSCAPRPGFPNDFDCAVAYTNDIAPLAPTAGTCTDPTPTPATRFRCGTASFIQFQLDNIAAQINTISNRTFFSGPSGSDSYTGATEELYWNPESSVGADANGDNIISADDTAVYTYRVTVDPSVVDPGDVVENIWRTAWSNGVGNVATYVTGNGAVAPNGTITGGVLQDDLASVTADCSFKFEATWAAVTAITAYKERGKTVVEWRTAGEASTLGFDLYRVDPSSGKETKVNRERLVAVRQAPGGLYRIVDHGAGAGPLRYRIVESSLSGGQTSYGPYDLQLATHPGGRPPMGKATSSALLAGYPSGAVDRARSAAAPAAEAVPSGKAKILVDRGGMVAVSAAELASAMGLAEIDVTTAIGAGNLRLEQGGAAVAWAAEGANAGVRFFAEPPPGVNAPKNVYWSSIAYGPQMAPKKASAKSGKPATSFAATALFEQDLEPRPEGLQDPDADWWFWKVVAPGSIPTATVSLDLQGLVSGSNSLVVELFGFPTTSTDGEYRASVTLNNTLLGEVTWALPHRLRTSFALPAGLLTNGANTLKIGAVKGVVLLDAAEVNHRRSFEVADDRLEFVAESATPVRVTGLSGAGAAIYDITDRRQPGRVTGVSISDAGNGSFSATFRPTTGRRYLAVGPNGFVARDLESDSTVGLRNPLNGADYVVITDAALWSGAQSLASYRSSTGFTTMVVDVREIYDEFGYGLLDPKAMREFLRYAVGNWQTPPTHVALVGKGTWDPRDLFAAGDNFVPPILVGSVLGLVASDTAIVDFDNDGVPELSIGRIPAVSSAEIEDYVAKLETYEANPGAWLGRAITLADNGDGVAGNFATDSAEISGLLATEGLTVVPINLASSASSAVTAARASLFSELSTGALVLNFVGHGGFDLLANEGLLKIADVPNLANAGRLPLFVTETCYVGYFTFPGYAALSEHLLLTANVGTIANWSPAGLSANNPAVELGGDIAARIAEPGTGTLGERVRAAIAAYLANGGTRSHTNPYNLLGDPAIEPN